jgi:hypothetical protein
MKRFDSTVVVLALLLGLAGISGMIYTWNVQPTQVETFGAGITLDKYTIPGYTASTTPVYLAAGASAPAMIMSVGNAQHVDLNIMMNASTSASVLTWAVSFSNDDGVNKNWFGEDVYSASGYTVTHASTTALNSWEPDLPGYSFKNIGIEPVASKYMKVVFTAVTAASTIYAEGISQSAVNN